MGNDNTNTITVTKTITPTITVTNTATPAVTASNTPTITVTKTLSPTVTKTITITPTNTQTNTLTNTITPTEACVCLELVNTGVTTSKVVVNTCNGFQSVINILPNNTVRYCCTSVVSADISISITSNGPCIGGVCPGSPTPTPTNSLTPTITPTKTVTPTITPTFTQTQI